MRKDILVIVIAVALSLGLGWLFNGGLNLGGAFTHTVNEVFLRGLRAGQSQTQVIDSSGNIVSNVSSTGASNFGSLALDGKDVIGEFDCATSTWNPGSIATSTLDGGAVTSTDIAISGAAMTDLCLASLDSATSTAAQVTCNVTSANTSTLTLLNLSASALDIATGTARVCYFGF